MNTYANFISYKNINHKSFITKIFILVTSIIIGSCKSINSYQSLKEIDYNNPLYNQSIQNALTKYNMKYKLGVSHFISTPNPNLILWLEEYMPYLWNSVQIANLQGGYKNTTIFEYQATFTIKKVCKKEENNVKYELKYILDTIKAPNLVKNFIILAQKLKFFTTSNQKTNNKIYYNEALHKFDEKNISRDLDFVIYREIPFVNIFGEGYLMNAENYYCKGKNNEILKVFPQKGDLVYLLKSTHSEEQADNTKLNTYIPDLLPKIEATKIGIFYYKLNDDEFKNRYLNSKYLQVAVFGKYIGDITKIDEFFGDLHRSIFSNSSFSQNCSFQIEDIKINKIGEKYIFANEKLNIPYTDEQELFKCDNLN